ncbi:MAG: hypothetical protein ACOYMN_20915, partial [Roseimicrobium sp.]
PVAALPRPPLPIPQPLLPPPPLATETLPLAIAVPEPTPEPEPEPIAQAIGALEVEDEVEQLPEPVALPAAAEVAPLVEALVPEPTVEPAPVLQVAPQPDILAEEPILGEPPAQQPPTTTTVIQPRTPSFGLWQLPMKTELVALELENAEARRVVPRWQVSEPPPRSAEPEAATDAEGTDSTPDTPSEAAPPETTSELAASPEVDALEERSAESAIVPETGTVPSVAPPLSTAPIANALLFPAERPERADDEAPEQSFWGSDLAAGKRRPSIPQHVKVTLALVSASFVISLLLLAHVGWQRMVGPRTKVARATSETAAHAAVSSPATPHVGALPTAQPGAAALAVSPAPAPAAPETVLSLEDEQAALEKQLEDAILAMRQDTAGPLAYGQKSEPELRSLLRRFQALSPKIAARETRSSTQALAIYRDIASLHLLCNQPQAARNVLLDMRELLARTHAEHSPEIRLADYLVQRVNASPAPTQSGPEPFPPTPSEMQQLLRTLRDAPRASTLEKPAASAPPATAAPR